MKTMAIVSLRSIMLFDLTASSYQSVYHLTLGKQQSVYHWTLGKQQSISTDWLALKFDRTR